MYVRQFNSKFIQKSTTRI